MTSSNTEKHRTIHEKIKDIRSKIAKSREADAVFEAGGVKGIGLLGALKRVEEEGITFKRVAGTSAGAIVASLYAAGYTTDELADLLINETNFKQFMDNGLARKPRRRLIGRPKRIFKMIFRVLENYGIYKGDIFYQWIKRKLKEKGVVYFKDLKIPLKVVTTDITNKRKLVFDSERHSHMEVAEAVRMSIGIAIFFCPYPWQDPESKTNCLMVNGGLLSRYPINIFDDVPERPTIGFKLIGLEESLPPEPISNIFSYLKSLIDVMMGAHERIHVAELNWARTIPIPTGTIKTTQFDLSKEDKQWLYDSGYQAAAKFFAKQKEES